MKEAPPTLWELLGLILLKAPPPLGSQLQSAPIGDLKLAQVPPRLCEKTQGPALSKAPPHFCNPSPTYPMRGDTTRPHLLQSPTAFGVFSSIHD